MSLDADFGLVGHTTAVAIEGNATALHDWIREHTVVVTAHDVRACVKERNASWPFIPRSVIQPVD